MKSQELRYLFLRFDAHQFLGVWKATGETLWLFRAFLFSWNILEEKKEREMGKTFFIIPLPNKKVNITIVFILMQMHYLNDTVPESVSSWSCLPSLIFSAMRCPLVGRHVDDTPDSTAVCPFESNKALPVSVGQRDGKKEKLSNTWANTRWLLKISTLVIIKPVNESVVLSTVVSPSADKVSECSCSAALSITLTWQWASVLSITVNRASSDRRWVV